VLAFVLGGTHLGARSGSDPHRHATVAEGTPMPAIWGAR
jgi:hypothetical protein